MSRKSDLNKLANFEGNAAAHRALYRDAAGIREADLYTDQAAETGETHTWNDDEVEHFREKAHRRAVRALKQREEDWRGRTYEELEAEAFRLIEVFIQARMR